MVVHLSFHGLEARFGTTSYANDNAHCFVDSGVQASFHALFQLTIEGKKEDLTVVAFG
jgi:hypothetical protein